LLKHASVNSFFKQDPYSSAVLIFRPANTHMKTFTIPQINSVVKDKTSSQRENQIKQMNVLFDKLIERKPGLGSYTPQAKDKHDKPDPIEDSSIVFLTYIVIMVLMLYKIVSSLNVFDQYYTSQPVVNAFYLTNYTDNSAIYTNLASYYDLYRFYDNRTKGYLTNPYFYSYQVVGKRRFVQARVKRTKCPIPSGYNSSYCAFEQGYSSATRDTSTLGNATWQTYQTANQTQMPKLTGIFGTYEGDGYAYDLPTNISIKDAKDFVNTLKSLNYIDGGTRAIMSAVLMYDHDRDYFIQFVQLIEINYLKGIQSTNWNYVFKIHYVSDYFPLFRIDVAKISLLGIVIFVSLIVHFFKGFRCNWKYLKSLENIYNLIVFGLALPGFLIFYESTVQSKQELLAKTDFIQLYQYGNDYNLSAVLTLWSFILLTYKMMSRFLLSSTMSNFFLIIKKSWVEIIYYLALCILVIIGVSICAQQVWGIKFLDFTDLLGSFFGLFSLFMQNNIPLRKQMIAANGGFGAAMIIFLAFLVWLNLNSMFLSIIMEKFRIIVLKQGNKGVKEETVFRKKINTYIERFRKRFQKGKAGEKPK